MIVLPVSNGFLHEIAQSMAVHIHVVSSHVLVQRLLFLRGKANLYGVGLPFVICTGLAALRPKGANTESLGVGQQLILADLQELGGPRLCVGLPLTL